LVKIATLATVFSSSPETEHSSRPNNKCL